MARLRIKDIAERAQVSPATVSRYLNGKWDAMSVATRERIARVIEQTGYRPSNAARSLRTERSRTVGVVLADIRNPYSAAMLEELDARAAEQGLSLMTATSGNDATREQAAIERLVDAGVDGLVVNSCADNAEALAQAASRVPCVLLDRDVPGCELSLVTSNNKALVAGLVAELYRAGCERLYLLNEHNATSLIRQERARAFEADLAARGLGGSVVTLTSDAAGAAAQLNALARDEQGCAAGTPGATRGCAAGTPEATRGCAAGTGPARTAEAPVGIIAINGLVLLRLIEALGGTDAATLGRLRIATFDEYAWNRVLLGGITTAVQDTRAIARTALELLASEDGAGERPRRTEIPGRIIARPSTQP